MKLVIAPIKKMPVQQDLDQLATEKWKNKQESPSPA
jgi:hypothetical protein